MYASLDGTVQIVNNHVSNQTETDNHVQAMVHVDTTTEIRSCARAVHTGLAIIVNSAVLVMLHTPKVVQGTEHALPKMVQLYVSVSQVGMGTIARARPNIRVLVTGLALTMPSANALTTRAARLKYILPVHTANDAKKIGSAAHAICIAIRQKNMCPRPTPMAFP